MLHTVHLVRNEVKLLVGHLVDSWVLLVAEVDWLMILDLGHSLHLDVIILLLLNKLILILILVRRLAFGGDFEEASLRSLVDVGNHVLDNFLVLLELLHSMLYSGREVILEDTQVVLVLLLIIKISLHLIFVKIIIGIRIHGLIMVVLLMLDSWFV